MVVAVIALSLWHGNMPAGIFFVAAGRSPMDAAERRDGELAAARRPVV
jgi:hypothetical protein